MSVGEESVVCPVLDDSVQHLCILHLEIDRYQRLARGEAGSGGESFLSASFELTIVSGVRAQLLETEHGRSPFSHELDVTGDP